MAGRVLIQDIIYKYVSLVLLNFVLRGWGIDSRSRTRKILGVNIFPALKCVKQ